MLCPGSTATPVTATAAVTVSAAEPVLPPLVAVIVAEPAATAVTSPEAETVATDVFEEVHAMVCPLRTLPDASFSVAVACAVCFTCRVELNDTLTVATGAGCDGGVGLLGALALAALSHF